MLEKEKFGEKFNMFKNGFDEKLLPEFLEFMSEFDNFVAFSEFADEFDRTSPEFKSATEFHKNAMENKSYSDMYSKVVEFKTGSTPDEHFKK